MYPKWVGVVLGFLLNGSAHFLSGDKISGAKWYFVIMLTGLSAVLILAIPGTSSYVISIFVFLISSALWFIMLKRSYRHVPKIKAWGWIAVIIVSMLLSSVWNFAIKQTVRTFKVPTRGMVPVIMPGDWLVAENISYRFRKPTRGDIVVFSTDGLKHPHVRSGTYFIQRIVGLPGETVQIKPPNLIVDGQIIRDPAVFMEISSRSNGIQLATGSVNPKPILSSADDEITLGDDEYLTLGDNTRNSLDGRYFGPIKKERILGRYSRIYWPLSRIDK